MFMGERTDIKENRKMNKEVTFEIIKQVGVLEEFQTGWTKELNIISWNGSKPKYDIRDWDENHERMSRGITLSEEQMKNLIELMMDQKLNHREYFNC